MVLGHRNNDLIAFVQKVHPVAVGDQIQRFGGVLRKDDLIIFRMKELCHTVTCALVGIGGTHGQLVTPRWGLALSCR